MLTEIKRSLMDVGSPGEESRCARFFFGTEGSCLAQHDAAYHPTASNSSGHSNRGLAAASLIQLFIATTGIGTTNCVEDGIGLDGMDTWHKSFLLRPEQTTISKFWPGFLLENRKRAIDKYDANHAEA